MKQTFAMSALSFMSLAASATASAQTRAPQDLDGGYSLRCDEATVVVGLQQFEIASGEGSVLLETPTNESIVFPPLPCDADALVDYVPDAYAYCLEQSGLSFLGDDLTDKLCAGVAAAIEGMLAPVATRLNGRFDVTVSPGAPVNDWLNLYGMDGDITDLTGATRDGDFLVNRRGHFVTATLWPAVLQLSSFCSTTLGAVTQAVSGDFVRGEPDTFAARYSGDVSLLCSLPGEDESTTVTTRIGLSLRAALSGARLGE